MKKRYYRTVFKRLTLSLLLSLVVMIVFMFFMEAIKGTVWEWFNKHISSNEETLIKTLVIIFFIISMTIFIASFMWLTFRRSSYIKKIVKAVEQISKGELSVRIPVNGDDELSYLSSSINNMVDELTVNMLEACGIPCLRVYPGDGSFGKLIFGMSGQGTDIYVPKSMAADAAALCNYKGDYEMEI